MRLGKYTLLTRLASGGMGEVYVAHLAGTAGFEKQVVIKRILPHLADDQAFVEMFLDEARITAQLNHPNICQVFELGRDDAEFYIAMEYLEGLPLTTLIKARPGQGLDVRVAAGCLLQACEGMEYAHDFHDAERGIDGVVHRDISPQNLFVTAAGVIKVLDFGVAKLYREGSQTVTGSAKGKYNYMSPEQVKGEPLDRRSDIFALGVVLFESLTGRRLFRRETEFHTFEAIVRGIRPKVLDYRPDVSVALHEVVEKALSLDTAQRFTSARSMAQAISSALAPHGGPATTSDIAAFMFEEHGHKIREQRDRVNQAYAILKSESDLLDTLEQEPRSRRKRQNTVPATPRAHDRSLPLGPPPECTNVGDIPAPGAAASTDGRRAATSASGKSSRHAATSASGQSSRHAATSASGKSGRRAATSASSKSGRHAATSASGKSGRHAASASGKSSAHAATSAAGTDSLPAPPLVPGTAVPVVPLSEPQPQAASSAMPDLAVVTLPRPPARSSRRWLLIGALLLAVTGPAAFLFGQRSASVGQRSAEPAALDSGLAHRTQAGGGSGAGLHGAEAPADAGAPAPAADAGAPAQAADAEVPAQADAAPDAQPQASVEDHEPSERRRRRDSRSSSSRRSSSRRDSSKAKEEPGFFTVDAVPYAEIYIGRKKIGVTPLVRIPLPPGRHSVRAVTASGDSKRIFITIEAGETATRRFSFQGSSKDD